MSEYAWFDLGHGRKVYRPVPKPQTGRSALPCPMIITDTIAPVESMADGRTYTSKAGLRRSYRADGNPQGVEYVEVGNSQNPHEQKRGAVVRDKQKSTNIIQKAIATADRGEGA